MIKRDLYTNEEFFSTRINQRFKNAQNRIKYYNEKANKFRHSISSINKPLQKNIRILEELMVDIDECVFHKQFLLGKGYDLNIYTHIFNFRNKHHFAIHQFLIIPISDVEIKILKYKK
jgi:hypothetical protein